LFSSLLCCQMNYFVAKADDFVQYACVRSDAGADLEARSAAPDLYEYENDRTDDEVDQQPPVFYKQRMAHDAGKLRHEQEINGVAGEHGHERIQEIAECGALGHRFFSAIHFCPLSGNRRLSSC